MPQPLVTEYETESVPALRPSATPELFMVARVVFVVAHVPPDTLSVNVVALPPHNTDAPVITPEIGAGLMVIVFVVESAPQALVTEYFMVSSPGFAPNTVPEVFTVAIVVFELLQTPPVTASVKVVEVP